MSFSPSELADFVELTCKMKGHVAANQLFFRVDPDYDDMIDDYGAKNWPAFSKLLTFQAEAFKNSLVVRGGNVIRGPLSGERPPHAPPLRPLSFK